MRPRGKVREKFLSIKWVADEDDKTAILKFGSAGTSHSNFCRGIANNELGRYVKIEFCLFVCIFAVRHQRTQNYNKRSCWLNFLYGLNGNGQVN